MGTDDLHCEQRQDSHVAEDFEGSPAHDWTLIAAVSANGVIGRSGELPWRLSTDLRRFKRLTMGHCLLMGRKTFESIGRALPGRQTIVLSLQSSVELPSGVQRARSLMHAARLVEPNRRVMVVGGAEIYQHALPCCSNLLITRVKAEIPGDTFFPSIDWSQWFLVSSEFQDSGPGDEWASEFQQWQRIKLAD